MCFPSEKLASATHRPSMDNKEGLGIIFEVAVKKRVPLSWNKVAKILVREFCTPDGELGVDVTVVHCLLSGVTWNKQYSCIYHHLACTSNYKHSEVYFALYYRHNICVRQKRMGLSQSYFLIPPKQFCFSSPLLAFLCLLELESHYSLYSCLGTMCIVNTLIQNQGIYNDQIKQTMRNRNTLILDLCLSHFHMLLQMFTIMLYLTTVTCNAFILQK